MKRSFGLSIFIIIVLSASMLLIGCSDNSINFNNATVDNINMKISVASQGMLDIVSTFQVIVTVRDEIRMIVPLDYEQGIISGTIENAPAGEAVTFTVQGLNATGRVIYSGTETIPVVEDPNENENRVDINLVPVVSLIKLSPRYNELAPGEKKSLDLEVYNLPDLNQISLRLISSNPLHDPDPDSVSISQRLLELGDNIILFDTISFEPPFYAMALANGGSENLVNDPNGNITLATLYYSADFQTEILPDSILITFEALTMYDTLGNLISSENVVSDQCFIKLTE